MRLEPLEACELFEQIRLRADGLRRVPDDRAAHDEVVHAERRREPRGAARREHVARPGGVIARRFGRVIAEEEGPGRADAVHEGVGVGDGQAEVLGREVVGDARRLGEIADDEAMPVRSHGGLRDRAARQIREAPLDGARDGVGLLAAQGDEHRVGVLVVLGLREEIGGDDLGVGAFVGHDEDLARARDRVDVDEAEDEALRAGDEDVARPDDLLDPSDRFGAVGERGDRLRASGVDDLRDAGDLGGGEDLGRGTRGREDDARHAGNGGRHGRHEHRARVAGLPAGGVYARRPDRDDALAELDPAFRIAETRLALVLVVAPDAIGGLGEAPPHGVGRLGGAGGDLFSREHEALLGATLEALRELADGAVAAVADLTQNGADVRLDPLEVGVAATREAREGAVVFAFSAFVDEQHGRGGVAGPALPGEAPWVQTARPMGLSIHNTLSGAKEPFTPSEPGHARIYVCGPTVYDYAHLGHARCYVIYDVLVRHLRANGMRVTFVRNYTDVDDKILRRAAERGTTPRELSERFEQAFREDMERLGNLEPDISPKVTEHIPEVIALVQKLVDGGHAYTSDGDVYFAVDTFPTYGKLSHRDLAQMKAGASERLDEERTQRKRSPADFVLWKGGEHEGATWDSPFGRGRPGWHIECSAMSMKHLGETFDLHGGGLDLVFPHHENEIAQSEAATGAPYATCWMHNGFVEVDSEKMAKSKGNFFTARELFERIEPEAVRLFVMTVHYRAPLNLDFALDAAGKPTSFPQLEEAERRLEYLYKTKERLLALPEARVVPVEGAPVPTAISGVADGIARALDDDLNMPVAIASVAEFLSAVNELCDVAMRKKGKAPKAVYEAAVRGFAAIETELGLGVADASALLTRVRDRRAQARGITPDFVEAKIAERTAARARKDFAAADGVRDELAALGVELHDSPEGTRWSMA